MKIVSIFAEKLFAFQYKDEKENELKRLLNLWNDAGYLYKFIKDNEGDIVGNSIEVLIEMLIEDAVSIDYLLNELATGDNRKLEEFFIQLHNNESGYHILSLRKGRKNYLRIYAIKIDDDCFIITGGAIKFTHLMEDRTHTHQELKKLERARLFFQEYDIFDGDSFYEFLNEEYDK